ncbi:MAG TPA: hypothetical protein VF482_01710 [Trebonia sp.]
MYHRLTDRELNIMQHMLFEGTEKAFWVVSENGRKLNSAEDYRAVHAELAALFIEAAAELSRRLERTPAAA